MGTALGVCGVYLWRRRFVVLGFTYRLAITTSDRRTTGGLKPALLQLGDSMTNDELEVIKSKLREARELIRKGDTVKSAICITQTIAVLDNVQKRAITFGRGPDCYNCDCKVKCERYAKA